MSILAMAQGKGCFVGLIVFSDIKFTFEPFHYFITSYYIYVNKIHRAHAVM